MKEYSLIANVAIEAKSEVIQNIVDELTYALAEICEKYESFCGGGFDFVTYRIAESKL